MSAKVGWTAEKLLQGHFSMKIPQLLPWNEIWNMFDNSTFYACRPESIGVLSVEIGWIVEKLLFGVFFHEISPIDSLESLESNLGIFEVSEFSTCWAEPIGMFIV